MLRHGLAAKKDALVAKNAGEVQTTRHLNPKTLNEGSDTLKITFSYRASIILLYYALPNNHLLIRGQAHSFKALRLKTPKFTCRYVSLCT